MTGSGVLPAVGTAEEYEALARDEAALRPGVDALCRALGLGTDGLSRYRSGSRPVYAAGELVLKLYPPVYPGGFDIEAGVLAAVDGELATATPRVAAAGERDGWGYLLMNRLPGTPLRDAWPELDRVAKDRLASEVGELIATLHRVPPPDIPRWWPPDFEDFAADQRSACAASQRQCGLADEWADQIPSFLDAVPLPAGPPVLLHTEIMREHLLVAPGPWRLSGLIDFEPAMRGAREYEFAAVGSFTSEGDARFLRRVLLAYGYAEADLDGALRRRLFAWLLLHRYSYLAGYLRNLPAPAAPTLDALADRWFATDA